MKDTIFVIGTQILLGLIGQLCGLGMWFGFVGVIVYAVILMLLTIFVLPPHYRIIQRSDDKYYPQVRIWFDYNDMYNPHTVQYGSFCNAVMYLDDVRDKKEPPTHHYKLGRLSNKDMVVVWKDGKCLDHKNLREC